MWLCLKNRVSHYRFCVEETTDIFSLLFETWMHSWEAAFHVWSLRVLCTEEWHGAYGYQDPSRATFLHHFLLSSLLLILVQTNFIAINVIIANFFFCLFEQSSGLNKLLGLHYWILIATLGDKFEDWG